MGVKALYKLANNNNNNNNNNPLLASFDDTLRRGLSPVLNVELSDKQWSQVNLPVQMGGLGVRRACMLASSASLASAAATLPLQNAILSESIKVAEDPAVSLATTTWTSVILSSIPVEAMTHSESLAHSSGSDSLPEDLG